MALRSQIRRGVNKTLPGVGTVVSGMGFSLWIHLLLESLLWRRRDGGYYEKKNPEETQQGLWAKAFSPGGADFQGLHTSTVRVFVLSKSRSATRHHVAAVHQSVYELTTTGPEEP